MYSILYRLFPLGVERVQAKKITTSDEAIREARYLLTIGASKVRVTNSKNETVFEDKK